MLEIKLERALEPEMMERQPCGMCGVEFQPEAVLIAVNIAGKYLDETLLCEPCLYHLGLRARDLGGASSPGWDWALVYYRRAVAKYPEPVFPSVAAQTRPRMAHLMAAARVGRTPFRGEKVAT